VLGPGGDLVHVFCRRLLIEHSEAHIVARGQSVEKLDLVGAGEIRRDLDAEHV